MDLLRNLRFARRLAILVGIFAGSFLLYGLWSFRTLDALRVNGPLYADVIQGKDLVADVLPPPLYIIESYLVALQLAAADKQAERDQLAQRLRTLHAQTLARQQYWQAARLERNLADTLQQCNSYAAAFYRDAFGELVPALERGDQALAEHALLAMKRNYELHRRVVDNLVNLVNSNARYLENQAVDRIRIDSMLLLAIYIGALALAIALAWLISRSITQPLAEALSLAQRVRAGDLSTPPPPPYHDEAGQLLAALHALQQSLGASAAAHSDSEQALRRARKLTERLLKGANVLVLGLGRHGEVLIFNDTAAAVTGCAADGILGRVWRDLPLLPMSAVALWPEGGHPDQFRAMPAANEHTIHTAAGDERRIAWRHTALEDGDLALLSFGIDVSEQRQAERAIAAAREIADSANRSKSAFLANMSHEIRTPLNAIIGLTQLTLQGQLEARERSYLQQVEGAANSLLAMFNDILDFSRIEAGRMRTEEITFSVREAAQQACAEHVAAARNKGLALECSIDPALPMELVGDAARLQQLLHHLLAHAIRFTEQGTVLLSVQRGEGGGQGTVLRCEVRDSGAARDAAVHMFEPLDKADGAAGLGLSVARQLAAMLGGHLTLESDPALGNRFIFTTVLRAALPADAPTAAEQAAANNGFPALCAAGVDVAGALHRLQGNEAQLRKLLGQFLHRQDSLPSMVEELLRKEDGQRAQRLLHALAGQAAHLGMEHVRQDAAALLNVLRAGGAGAAELAQLAPRLEQVLQAIRADLAPPGAAGKSGEQAA